MALVRMISASYDRCVSYLLDGLEGGSEAGRSQEAQIEAALPRVMAIGIESKIF